MHMLIPRSTALFFTLLLGTVGPWSAAHAQIGPMDPTQMLSHQAQTAVPTGTKQIPPPPALPGAASRTGAAPAMRIPLDMSPNDALFDAINRGDVPAARDALGRGADLSAQNLLGMTPTELSVDLGRNDISFLLLSYRGSDDSRDRQAPGTVEATTAATPNKMRPTSPKASTPIKAPPRTSAILAKAVVPVPSSAQPPRLFANDGGAPVPSVGFLGFDSRAGGR